MPWELIEVLDRETVREGLRRLKLLKLVEAELTPRPNSSFAKVAILEASLYMRNQLLRDTDWASMAHGLEVRVPLVDATLLRAIAPLSLGRQTIAGKMNLAQSPMTPLPAAVAIRDKTGFTTPVASWLQFSADGDMRACRHLLLRIAIGRGAGRIVLWQLHRRSDHCDSQQADAV